MPGRNKPVSALDKYAREYDLMTNAAQREAYHSEEVQAIIERCYPTRVLDAGCATGLTTSLFARKGVEALGLDRSRPMLAVASEKYEQSVLPVRFTYGTFQKLPRSMDSSFDLVVCLANAITGVESKSELMASLKGFHRVLSGRGYLILQMLNYLTLKDGAVQPIRATENDGIVYARYSQRRGKKLALHVVRVDLNANPPSTEPFVHEFDNYTPDEMLAAVKRAGFNHVRSFADLYLKKRFTKSSRNLVILAQR